MARMKDRGNRRKAKKMLFIPNLHGVEGKRASLAPGRYTFKITEAEQRESQAGNDYLSFKLEEVETGAIVYYNLSMHENSLWNLRGWLEALGMDIPDEEQELDPTDFEGLMIECEVDDETYEGKKRSTVTDYSPAEEDTGGSKKKRKSSSKKSDEDEDDAEEEDAPPAKARKSKRNAKARDEDADDEEDEDSDEEEAAPRSRKSKKASGKKKSLTADEVKDMDEDELVSLVEEKELDIDLGDYKTLRKKAAAVIEAMDLE